MNVRSTLRHGDKLTGTINGKGFEIRMNGEPATWEHPKKISISEFKIQAEYFKMYLRLIDDVKWNSIEIVHEWIQEGRYDA